MKRQIYCNISGKIFSVHYNSDGQITMFNCLEKIIESDGESYCGKKQIDEISERCLRYPAVQRLIEFQLSINK